VPEKRLVNDTVKELGIPEGRLMETIARLGKSAGPPWGKDQKSAALAAMIAFRGLSDPAHTLIAPSG
jgi:hypothetical protein